MMDDNNDISDFRGYALGILMGVTGSIDKGDCLVASVDIENEMMHETINGRAVSASNGWRTVTVRYFDKRWDNRAEALQAAFDD